MNSKNFLIIQENSLPVSYLDEIVEYIKTNIPEARAFTEQQSHRPKPSERISLNGRVYFILFLMH